MLAKLLPAVLTLGAFAGAAAPLHAGDLSLGLVLGNERGRLELSLGDDDGYGYKHRGRLVVGCESKRRCHPVFVPGHYETVERRVWIPETKEKIWVEPIYETRYDSCGRPYRVLVCDGTWRVVVHPGHYETRCERVYVDGGWADRCGRH